MPWGILAVRTFLNMFPPSGPPNQPDYVNVRYIQEIHKTQQFLNRMNAH